MSDTAFIVGVVVLSSPYLFSAGVAVAYAVARLRQPWTCCRCSREMPDVATWTARNGQAPYGGAKPPFERDKLPVSMSGCRL